METTRGTSEFQSISKKFAAAKKQPREIAPKVDSTEKASQLKSLYIGTLAFFSWLLYVFPIHGSEEMLMQLVSFTLLEFICSPEAFS